MPPSVRPPTWVTASELAEYEFCPRAHWYRAHPPDAPPRRAALRTVRDGSAYHRSEGLAILRSERAGLVGPVLLVVVGTAALLVLLLLTVP